MTTQPDPDRPEEYVSDAIQMRLSKGKGRGYFAERPIRRHELVMVSRAVALVRPTGDAARDLQLLQDAVDAGLARADPQHRAAYENLYVSPDYKADLLNRFNFNAYRTEPRLDAEYDMKRSLGSPEAGIFTYASFFNHSCVPNCAKYYVGDCMWVIANRDIAAGEELYLSYLENEENYLNLEGRTKLLAHYFRRCKCELCELQRSTAYVQMQLRLDKILALAEKQTKPTAEDLKKYKELAAEVRAECVKTPWFALDGETEAGRYLLERLGSQLDENEYDELMDMACYGFSRDRAAALLPETMQVIRKMLYIKQSGRNVA